MRGKKTLRRCNGQCGKQRAHVANVPSDYRGDSVNDRDLADQGIVEARSDCTPGRIAMDHVVGLGRSQSHQGGNGAQTSQCRLHFFRRETERRSVRVNVAYAAANLCAAIASRFGSRMVKTAKEDA